MRILPRPIRSLPALATGLLLLGLTNLPGQEEFKPDERSISGDKQFYVYAQNVEARQMMARTASDLRRGVERLLALPARKFSHPIVITLSGPQPIDDPRPPVSTQLYNTAGGLKVQLAFVIKPAHTKVELPVEIVRAILLEIAAADLTEIPAGVPYNLPPDWLALGMLEWIKVQENGAPAPVFSGLIEARLPFQELLGQPYASLDATSKDLFRAYAYCLIRLLLDQPGGRAGLVSLVRNAPGRPTGDLAVLNEFFPKLTENGEQLEKWWMLNIAKIVKGQASALLTPRQTEVRLKKALEFDTDLGKGKTRLNLADYAQVMKLKNRSDILGQVKTQLLRMTSTASPFYRPILSDYDVLVTNLQAGRSKEADAHLARLDMLRELTLKRSTAIDDYLNWFEATQMNVMSGSFDGVLETTKAGPDPLRRNRNDPVTLYLDSLEKELR